MRKYLEILDDKKNKFFIEVSEASVTDEEDSLLVNAAFDGKVVRNARKFFDDSVRQISNFSSGIVESMKNAVIQPDEVEVEFSVKFGADANVIISSFSSEANITIRMKWAKKME